MGGKDLWAERQAWATAKRREVTRPFGSRRIVRLNESEVLVGDDEIDLHDIVSVVAGRRRRGTHQVLMPSSLTLFSSPGLMCAYPISPINAVVSKITYCPACH